MSKIDLRTAPARVINWLAADMHGFKNLAFDGDNVVSPDPEDSLAMDVHRFTSNFDSCMPLVLEHKISMVAVPPTSASDGLDTWRAGCPTGGLFAAGADYMQTAMRCVLMDHYGTDEVVPPSDLVLALAVPDFSDAFVPISHRYPGA